jgi:hypothetical protein
MEEVGYLPDPADPFRANLDQDRLLVKVARLYH